jgi:hypothetical protein
MRPHWLLIVSCFCIISTNVVGQSLWTIGPMLHVNFGGEKRTVSFTLEAAYWNVSQFPYSVDFGIEFDRKKTRFYSELQTGIGVTGLSAGPVLQFGQGGPKFGFQGSCWINYYLGVDYRMRFLREEKIRSVGTYFKPPIATSGLEGDGGDLDWDDDWD